VRADWAPGVPLYPHPTEREYGDGNYLRHLFDLLPDEWNAVHNMLYPVIHAEAVCAHCLVGWPASEGPACWVCGKDAANYQQALEYEEEQRATSEWATLRGGPAHGYRYPVNYNDGDDRDHIWVRVTDRVTDWGRCVQVTQPVESGAHGIELHRYRRTPEWHNHQRAYTFVYEGVMI
jgi:hypothetical protein